MTARKIRPEHGAPITDGMSIRDMAASLGISTGEFCRWRTLAAIPEAEFEARLADLHDMGAMPTTSSIIKGAPVPARGRVERAQAIVANMTAEESVAFLNWIMSEIKDAYQIRSAHNNN